MWITLSCRLCQKRHHSLLHPGFEATAPVKENVNPSPHQQNIRQIPPNVSTNVARVNEERNSFVSNIHQPFSGAAPGSRSSSVLLSTVVLVILDKHGKERLAWALLDSGSQCNLISERLCQLLQLPRHRIDQSIFGGGESKLRVTGSVTTEIKSRVGNFSHTTDFLVLRNITPDIPVVSLPVTS